MRKRTPGEYRDLERFRDVCAHGSELVCTSARYDFEYRDKVYPPGERFISVANGFGGYDLKDNPNYRRK
jgi:hypothetical protein